MNNILNDIEELKQDIINTDEYKEYKKSEELLNNNSEVKSLIKEITVIQKELVRKNNKDYDLDNRLTELYDKLNNIDEYKKYIDSSKNLNILISNIQKDFEYYFNSLIK
jgi:cell fate (sporulation/competence/biofilm development) regulator YlbF (YheA/YmcA/DUF963 family)